jgi:hypothetical protein
MEKTLDEIRRKGLEALRRELGRSGMVRFLQQFDLGSGNYAKERQKWADEETLEKLRAASKRKKKPKK